MIIEKRYNGKSRNERHWRSCQCKSEEFEAMARCEFDIFDNCFIFSVGMSDQFLSTIYHSSLSKLLVVTKNKATNVTIRLVRIEEKSLTTHTIALYIPYSGIEDGIKDRLPSLIHKL